MRSIFLPVWGPGITSRIHKWIPAYSSDDKWFDLPPLQYPHGLVSYLAYRTYKLRLSFPDGSYIFGDSSGFTLISNPSEVLDPVEILQWQDATTSVGAVLDRPPRRVKIRDWQGCLDFTCRNVARALPYYQRRLEAGTRFRWWGVLHGNDERETNAWYKTLRKVYPFSSPGEGWAVYPGPQAHPFTVARTMRMLQELGIKHAHFLACTGQDVIATILALGPKAGLELVTFDSFSHAVGSFNRWWFTTDPELSGRRGRSHKKSASGVTSGSPHQQRRKTRRELDYVFESVRCLDESSDKFCQACPCTVCSYIRLVSPERFGDPNQIGQAGWRDAMIVLHNVNVQRECIVRQTELAAANAENFLCEALDPITAAKTFRIFAGREPDRPVNTGSNLGLLASLK